MKLIIEAEIVPEERTEWGYQECDSCDLKSVCDILDLISPVRLERYIR